MDTARYLAPPQDNSEAGLAAWERDLAQVRAEAEQANKTSRAEERDRTHTEVQARLRDLGRDAMARFGSGLKAIEAVAKEML